MKIPPCTEVATSHPPLYCILPAAPWDPSLHAAGHVWSFDQITYVPPAVRAADPLCLQPTAVGATCVRAEGHKGKHRDHRNPDCVLGHEMKEKGSGYSCRQPGDHGAGQRARALWIKAGGCGCDGYPSVKLVGCPVHDPLVKPEAVEPIARTFHEFYERLAPSYGYKTREASAVAWEDVPSANRNLMQGVVAELMRSGVITPGEAAA